MRDSALINRCHESREVANHPATKTYDERFSVKAGYNHSIANRGGLLECFGFFSRWNCDQRLAKARGCQTFYYLVGEQSRDVAVGDNSASSSRHIFAYTLADSIKQTRADQYRRGIHADKNLRDIIDQGAQQAQR